jgi:phenylalanyl-tRNA synthetase beta chain
MACDMADQGYTIEPVTVEYDYDTHFGRTMTTPFYFQSPVFCSLERIEKFLGEKLNGDECIEALERMGYKAEKACDVERGGTSAVDGVRLYPPEYRNDFLHAADIAEDVMIGRGLAAFKPERPQDFTVGRLSPITIFSRKVKEILVGLGYQEMIYNYLGSKKDLVDKVLGNGSRIIQIANPMTENYEYVRDSVLASLLMSESVSGNAVYPHHIFEIGKVTFKDPSENYGTATRQYLGMLSANKEANFNTIAAQIQTLFHYFSREYTVDESTDSRFIPGRAASVAYHDKTIGVFGEIHPATLENFGIIVPCIAAEIDLDALL